MDDFKRVDVTTKTPATGASSTDKKTKPSKKKRRIIPKMSTIIIVVLLFALAGGGYYFYNKYSETKQEVEKLSTVQGQQELSKTQTQELLSELRSIAITPTDSGDPTVATVVDASKLKSSASDDLKEFYKNTQDNDQVVVFQKDQQLTIYIFRPSDKKIVNIGTFKIDPQTQQQPGQTAN